MGTSLALSAFLSESRRKDVIMGAPQVRSDYDQLKNIQKSFSAQAENVAKSTQNIRSVMDKLQGGDWIGEGAQKFYQEMNDQVLPTMNRLNKALQEASRATAQISQLMKKAEEEASGILHI
jgi:WXG100 family type VII secretion target